MLKYGLSINPHETIQKIVEKSIEMEKLSFDYVWVTDTSLKSDFYTVASIIAEKTSNIRIGIGLLSPLLYTSSQIAKNIIMLTKQYGDRFELCIGPGDRGQLKRVGIQLSKVKRIPELLLRVEWEINVSFKQEKLEIPIWLGAQGPRMLRIAKFFHGVLLNYADLELIKWAVKEMDLPYSHSVQIGIYAPSYVYTCKDKQLYDLLKLSSITVALGTVKSVLERIGLYEEILKIKRELRSGVALKDIVNIVPEEVIEKFSIHMPSNTLKNYLLKLKEIGIKHVVFGYPQNISKETIRTLMLSISS
ncbi:MAG: LLM class flavin-dependent oxidoreductase [Candidatus Methanomethylicia archaeon]